MQKSIFVTSPLLPSLDEFKLCLDHIWEEKWLTNNGQYHQKLEKALADYLEVSFISLFTNGTIPLQVAIQALGIEGEIITSPFSFVATSHSIMLAGAKPVFVDVDPVTGNMNPHTIEAAITKKTAAIMPVHVYGNPCDTKAIQDIADKHNLKVIYDAAHAFGVKVNGKSLLNEGDVATLSFHATKVFNTVEGGALVCNNEITKQLVERLRNFGIYDEAMVTEVGLNGKMDELRSAYGLLTLARVTEAINMRKKIAECYRSRLAEIAGIRYFDDMQGVEHNYAYFPIFVHQKEYGLSRDELYEQLKEHGFFGRRYFYPLISSFPMYRDLPSASSSNVPVATQLAEEVLCLPIYAELEIEQVEKICGVIKKIQIN